MRLRAVFAKEKRRAIQDRVNKEPVVSGRSMAAYSVGRRVRLGNEQCESSARMNQGTTGHWDFVGKRSERLVLRKQCR